MSVWSVAWPVSTVLQHRSTIAETSIGSVSATLRPSRANVTQVVDERLAAVKCGLGLGEMLAIAVTLGQFQTTVDHVQRASGSWLATLANSSSRSFCRWSSVSRSRYSVMSCVM